MKMMLALSMPLLITTVLAVGLPDPSDISRWLLKAFILAAGLFTGVLAVRVMAEGRARRNILASARRLRGEGREVNSSDLAVVADMPEERVQLYLPALALDLGARTVWYEEGGGRHQRLEWPPR